MQSQLIRSISRVVDNSRTKSILTLCKAKKNVIKAGCSNQTLFKQYSTSANLNNGTDSASSQTFHDNQAKSTRSFNKPVLYPGHVPTSAIQKGLLAIGSALVSLYNPLRTDMVAALGETTGPIALRHLYEKMLDHPVGRQILTEKPQITPETLPLDKLLQYPVGTLGREYAEFMSTHGFGSDNRPSVRFIDDPELAYVMTRYRQVHDFWHVLSGLETDVFGEIALKWFEFMQTGLPMAALSTLAFPFKLSLKEQSILTRVYLPWAVECSKSCVFLMNVHYEKILDRPVAELREEFGFIKPPRQSHSEQQH